VPQEISEDKLKAIENAVRAHLEGVTAQQIVDALKDSIPRRTLQYWLNHLVRQKRLVQEGSRRWAKYRLPGAPEATSAVADGEQAIPLSVGSREIQAYLRRPVEARKPVGYDHAFLDSYRPNASSYLSAVERAHLRESASPRPATSRPAPTPSRF